jgi:alkylation response protein AidB-like acyl-CoA dehydrogenase
MKVSQNGVRRDLQIRRRNDAIEYILQHQQTVLEQRLIQYGADSDPALQARLVQQSQAETAAKIEEAKQLYPVSSFNEYNIDRLTPRMVYSRLQRLWRTDQQHTAFVSVAAYTLAVAVCTVLVQLALVYCQKDTVKPGAETTETSYLLNRK